jgi:hypothetical protein
MGEREWEPQLTLGLETPPTRPCRGGRANLMGGDGPLQSGKGDPCPTLLTQDQCEGIPLTRLALDGGLGQLKIDGVPSHGSGCPVGLNRGGGNTLRPAGS